MLGNILDLAASIYTVILCRLHRIFCGLEKAVLIDRPDDIIKASIPYMIIPCIVCFVAVFTKKAQVDEFIFDLWFMPLSFIIGFFVAVPDAAAYSVSILFPGYAVLPRKDQACRLHSV